MPEPSQELPKSNTKFIVLSLALIAVLGVCAYANSLHGQLLWDDETLVQFNPYIKDSSHLGRIFTSRLGSTAKEAGAFYRPIQTFTYFIDYSIWRLNVFGFHLVNMIWHILAAFSVFGLVQALFKNRRISLITALLFVVHPIHTEAVSYIAGRADSLVTAFMLSAYILYLRYGDRPKNSTLIGMAFCYLLAMLSKEISLILPVLIWLYHFSYKKPVNKKPFTVLAGTIVAYGLWRLLVIGSAQIAEGAVPTFMQRLPGVFVAFTNYLRLMVWPLGLHMEYGGILFRASEPKVFIGVLLAAVLVFFMVRSREKDPFIFFSLGWFFVALFPSSNIAFPINAYMAEHWLYLPSIGLILIAARFLSAMMEREKLKGLALAVLIAVLAFLTALTIRQNRFWSNGITFYKKMLEYAPKSSRLYNNLAKAYHDAGKNEELIELLQSSIKLKPDNVLAYNNLGNALKGVGRYAEAKKAYERAIELDPHHAGAYYNLSTIYTDIEGNNEAAIELLAKAIQMSPDFSKTYIKLALIYLDMGQKEYAMELLTTALKLNPDDPEVYHNFGYIYFQSGDQKRAEAMYKKALEVDPNYAEAYHDLAIIYINAKKYQLAIKYADIAAKLGLRNDQLMRALQPYR